MIKPPKINILRGALRDDPKKQTLPRAVLYPLIFAGVFLLVFSFQVLLSDESITDSFKKLNIFSGGLSFSDEKMLKGEEEDRINILLLGQGGPGHPGPFLTDTIIIASIKPSTQEVSFLSIPRDLSVPIPGYGWRKINNINSFGELDSDTTGPEFASQVTGDIFGLPIHYYVRVDFSGFEDLIDELGGLKIYVDTAFTDYQYPDNDFGYQTVSFGKGWQKMDGETALKYARSRHGTNGESSDFARSQRQQKVLKAIKDQALSFSTFLNIRKISNLMGIYNEHVVTNLEPWEIFKLAKIGKGVREDNIDVLVLDNHPSSPLYSKIIDGAYLLLPKDESFGELKKIAAQVFDGNDTLRKIENTVVEIQNGTRIEGLGGKTSATLRSKGYTITSVQNAARQDYEKTVVYDLTNGQKPQALEDLKAMLNANVSTTPPSWLVSAAQAHESSVSRTASDFIIILGQDQGV